MTEIRYNTKDMTEVHVTDIDASHVVNPYLMENFLRDEHITAGVGTAVRYAMDELRAKHGNMIVVQYEPATIVGDRRWSNVRLVIARVSDGRVVATITTSEIVVMDRSDARAIVTELQGAYLDVTDSEVTKGRTIITLSNGQPKRRTRKREAITV